jgi:hypothetical protein
MVLLVEIAKGDGVGEDLIQILHAPGTNFFIESDGETRNSAVRLNFTALLMRDGMGAIAGLSRGRFAVRSGTHGFSLGMAAAGQKIEEAEEYR